MPSENYVAALSASSDFGRRIEEKMLRAEPAVERQIVGSLASSNS